MRVEEVMELAVQCKLIDAGIIDRDTKDNLLQFAGMCYAIGVATAGRKQDGLSSMGLEPTRIAYKPVLGCD